MGCASNAENKPCHIHGTLPDSSYNGYRVFLISTETMGKDGNKGVDSVEVQNQQFDFHVDRNEVAIIRMSWKRRFGLEDLLVVVEPGEINVTLDSISSSGGTPMNDSLQAWKELTMQHNQKTNKIRREITRLYYEEKDSAGVIPLKAEIDSLNDIYKDKSKVLVSHLPQGPLKDFLKKILSI